LLAVESPTTKTVGKAGFNGTAAAAEVCTGVGVGCVEVPAAVCAWERDSARIIAAGRRPGRARFNLGIVEVPFAEAASRLGFEEGRLLWGFAFAIGTSLAASSGLRADVLFFRWKSTRLSASRELEGI
jgi:hypothetical protein